VPTIGILPDGPHTTAIVQLHYVQCPVPQTHHRQMRTEERQTTSVQLHPQRVQRLGIGNYCCSNGCLIGCWHRSTHQIHSPPMDTANSHTPPFNHVKWFEPHTRKQFGNTSEPPPSSRQNSFKAPRSARAAQYPTHKRTLRSLSHRCSRVNRGRSACRGRCRWPGCNSSKI